MGEQTPIFQLSQQQASDLTAQMLVYLQYLRLRVTPSAQRNQQMRMLQVLIRRLFSLVDQEQPLNRLTCTREEQALMKEGLSVLVRTLQGKPASPDRELEMRKLTAMQLVITGAGRLTHD